MAGKGPPPRPERVVKAFDAPAGPRRPRAALRCPPWLTGLAAATWREVAPRLAAAGAVCSLDRGVLASYCIAVAELAAATETLEREGRTTPTTTGTLKSHPAVAAQRSAAAMVRIAGDALGLTPTGRLRLRIDAPPPDEADPFEQFLQRRGPQEKGGVS